MTYFYIKKDKNISLGKNTLNTKIIIVGSCASEQDRVNIINKITWLDETVNAVNRFTTGAGFPKNKNANSLYKYHIAYNDVLSAFKNNSVVWCRLDSSQSDVTEGVMSDDWENGDIMQCSFREFNLIYNTYIEKCDNMLCVWCENGYGGAREKTEAERAAQRIRELEIPCLYFNIRENKETTSEVASAITEYVNAESDEERSRILFENS